MEIRKEDGRWYESMLMEMMLVMMIPDRLKHAGKDLVDGGIWVDGMLLSRCGMFYCRRRKRQKLEYVL